MINKPEKLYKHHFYNDKSNTIDEYTDPSIKYYLNMINHEQNLFDYNINNNHNLINKVNSSHFNQEKNKDFLIYNDNYQIKTLKNYYYNKDKKSNSNSIKKFNLYDNNLSNLSYNKYRLFKDKKIYDYENKDFQTILYDIDSSYRKQSLNEYINSSNHINSQSKKENDFYGNENIYDNFDNEDSLYLGNIYENNKLKNRIKLNKEIINYNNLEKKINKKIRNSKKNLLLKKFTSNYNTYDENIKNNTQKINKKGNKINESFFNNMKKYNNSLKKLSKIEGMEDITQIGSAKRNSTLNNSKNKEKNLNSSFIKYLKKDNQKLLQINTIYKQLIDTFFYFINQLSQKYSFKEKIQNINYYLSNSNELSHILIDLEQHLNKLINNSSISKNIEKVKEEGDDEQELLNKSKFISINLGSTIKNKNIEKPIYKTRNENIGKQYFSQISKKYISSKNIGNKSLQDNSLIHFNSIEGINNESIKINNKTHKGKKNNSKLIKILNKLNIKGKQKNLNNKIIIRKNNLSVNNN